MFFFFLSSPEFTNCVCSTKETDASCCLFFRLRFIMDMLVCVCVCVCIGYGALQCFWEHFVKLKHAHPPVWSPADWVTDASKPQSASKNGKKSDSGSSSFFTWFIVLALLGVWTSVAVVYFDLVDYQGVLGKWSPKLARFICHTPSRFIGFLKKVFLLIFFLVFVKLNAWLNIYCSFVFACRQG